MLTCSKCGYNQNPVHAKRCERCNSNLASGAYQSGQHSLEVSDPDPSMDDTDPNIAIEEVIDGTIDSNPTRDTYVPMMVQAEDAQRPTQEAPVVAEAVAAPPASPITHRSCPYCGQALPHTLELKERFCETCGTRQVPDAKFCHQCGAEQPEPIPVLTLVITGEAGAELTRFTIEDAEKRWVVGRTIEQLNHFVDIDLTNYGAKERGVSRTHAEIRFDANSAHWLITDMGSQFGTFINEQQLSAQQPFPLENDQKLRFGGVEAGITLE